VSTLVPRLFAGLVDDASVLSPGITGVTDALASFRAHEKAWFATLMGSFLVPSSLADADRSWAGVPVGVVNDTTIGGLPAVVTKLRSAGADVRRVEAAVACRGEDPQPGLGELRRLAGVLDDLEVYAEIPLSWGLLAGLDTVAEARAAGLRIAPKFRVGGLAAELFPTPVELAAVICACRDRDLPFRLAAGLRHALRHTDPETGFLHHGFLNVLAGSIAAADGAEAADVAEVLATTDAVPLVEAVRSQLEVDRPLWTGYGTCSITDPIDDMRRLGLLFPPP